MKKIMLVLLLVVFLAGCSEDPQILLQNFNDCWDNEFIPELAELTAIKIIPENAPLLESQLQKMEITHAKCMVLRDKFVKVAKKKEVLSLAIELSEKKEYDFAKQRSMYANIFENEVNNLDLIATAKKELQECITSFAVINRGGIESHIFEKAAECLEIHHKYLQQSLQHPGLREELEKFNKEIEAINSIYRNLKVKEKISELHLKLSTCINKFYSNCEVVTEGQCLEIYLECGLIYADLKDLAELYPDMVSYITDMDDDWKPIQDSGRLYYRELN